MLSSTLLYHSPTEKRQATVSRICIPMSKCSLSASLSGTFCSPSILPCPCSDRSDGSWSMSCRSSFCCSTLLTFRFFLVRLLSLVFVTMTLYFTYVSLPSAKLTRSSQGSSKQLQSIRQGYARCLRHLHHGFVLYLSHSNHRNLELLETNLHTWGLMGSPSVLLAGHDCWHTRLKQSSYVKVRMQHGHGGMDSRRVLCQCSL